MPTARVFLIILCLCCGMPVFAQTALVTGSQPISLGMSLQANALALDISVAVAGTVAVYCPIVPGLISFTGLTAKIETSYNQQSHVLQLSLPPGHYKVMVRSLP